ncbi:glyoxylase-like metal-dependent hydrolase (beta-lactamase superfamily II) [Ureibacillus xyleni]|uniref:Glyoxylase-like metal-dependent hydrolase (Beta-lactamase superfamily II) n=1 Tax=Ureibacillus xyleni TaxID=614648 RepID=A0A285SD34_9BACL|nr:MBL fold metallo-hydrolase [Ureibacillus xyleni]SOC05422.1 glyoxylase-like metal-dependent hydrolase (beta-lactamase superfamily II) [Ureibacillus xyleni]
MNIHKIILPTPFPVGDVNCFLVKGDCLTLFDAGPKTEEAYEALRWGIREAGYKLEDVEQVILTHHHPDHAGWVDAFPRAQVLGHEYVDHWMKQTTEFINYRNEFYRQHLRLQGVPERYIEKIVQVREELEMLGTTPLTKYICDGEEISGHPGLRAYYTPGHAQSHLIFLDEKSNEMIGGDLLLEHIASNPLVEPPVDLSLERPKSLVQYHHSLEILKQLNVTKLYTGHGKNLENVNELITNRLLKDQHRAMEVLELLSTPKNVFELTMELYAQVFKSQLGLTLSKTVGYLDYLEKEGAVKGQLIDGVLYYSHLK